jgi:predicted ribosome quality control (RQC) complex YloA/Tae2 family protein
MKTRLGNLLTAWMAVLLVSLSSLTMAAPPVDTPEIVAAAENATTQRAHEGLAKYYEEAAAQIQAKIEDKKELLEHYEDKSYLYGRRAQDLQAHTHALIRNYEKAVRTNRQAATSHRQIASRLNETQAASGTQALNSASGL